MARRILVPAGTSGASSAGAGGAGIIQAPTAVGSANLTGVMSAWQGSWAALTQLSANQFMYARGGRNTSTNTIRWYAQAFQVDNNGNITVGGSNYVQNSSGTSESTHQGASTAPGSISHCSRWHYNGTYYINHVQFQCNTSNQIVNADRYSPGDYSNSYMHPTSGPPVGSGSWTSTSGTRYVGYMGYNTSGHGGYTIWSNNSYYSGTTVNSYSSTGYTNACMQWWSDTSSRMGYGNDHRSSTNGWYWQMFHSGTGFTGLGYNDIFGNTQRQGQYNQVHGFAYVDRSNPGNSTNRGVCLNNATGGFIMYDKNGSNGTTNGNITGTAGLSNASTSYAYHSSFPCGVNKFVVRTDGGMGQFVDLSMDSSTQARMDSFNDSFIQNVPGFYSTSPGTGSGAQYTRCAIGGNNNQFLISVTNGKVSVYDISSFVDLSSHVTA